MVGRPDGEEALEVVVDEDVLDDGQVEAAADFVAGVHVQLAGCFEQAQVSLDELDVVVEGVDEGLQLGGEGLTFSADFAELARVISMELHWWLMPEVEERI